TSHAESSAISQSNPSPASCDIGVGASAPDDIPTCEGGMVATPRSFAVVPRQRYPCDRRAEIALAPVCHSMETHGDKAVGGIDRASTDKKVRCGVPLTIEGGDKGLAQAALERVVLLADRGGQVILELAEEDALLGPLVAPVVGVHRQQPLHAVRADVQAFEVE